MMREATPELKNWLYDLVMNRLEYEQIVQGFIRHYVLSGLAIDNVKQDIVYHTNYSAVDCSYAIDNLRMALQWFSEREESRTLTEVQRIVEAVREGMPVRVAYYDPDQDDDEYVVRACW